MKVFIKLALLSALAIAPLATLSSCSGSDSDSDSAASTQRVVTENDFRNGGSSFIVYGPSVFYVVPTGSYTSDGETGGTIMTTGNLLVGESVIPVYYEYETLGDPNNPSNGIVKVTLVDAAGYAANSDLLGCLALVDSTRIQELLINFSFLTSSCDVAGTGVQTRSSASGGTQDVFVTITLNANDFQISASDF